MPSFDVVSKIDWSEFNNALMQAQREIAQRFDFKDTDTTIEKNEAGVLILASTDERARAALGVLEEKLVRRKVSLKHLEQQKPERGPKGTSKLLVKIEEGIEPEIAREIVKLVKEAKLKAQASIHEDSVRVTGKKRDDLQTVIQLLKGTDFPDVELQFTNFRE